MQTTVSGSDLTKALALARGIVNKSSPMDIYKCVRVELQTAAESDPVMLVTATDDTQSITIQIKTVSPIQDPGVVALNAEDFTKRAGIFSNKDVIFSVNLETHEATLRDSKGGKKHVPVRGLAAADFPVMAVGAGGGATYVLRVQSKNFAAGLARVLFCASTAEAALLATVCVKIKGDRAVLAATDGHRVIHTSIPVDGEYPVLPTLLVPTEAVKTIIALLEDLNEIVDVNIGNNAISFKLSTGTEWLGRLMEGVFPNVEGVIPAAQVNRFRVPVARLCEELSDALVVESERPCSCRLAFTKDKVVISTTTEFAESDEIDVLLVAGGDTASHYNARYVLDFAAGAGIGEIEIGLDGNGPLVMRELDAEGNAIGATYAVMPIRAPVPIQKIEA